jgi:hypothetical protein
MILAAPVGDVLVELAPNCPRSAHPHFDESLRRLVVEERFALTDVGMMFGVSRERVRQWCVARGIPTPGHRGGAACRVWDDQAHRFVGSTKGELRRLARATRREARLTQRAARHQEMQARIIALRDAVGRRDLTVQEIAAVVFGRPVSVRCGMLRVCERWCPGYRRKGIPPRDVLADLRAACGLERVPVGFQNHRRRAGAVDSPLHPVRRL